MKKLTSIGAMLIALALSLASCNLPASSNSSSNSSSDPNETDYVKLRAAGKFTKIPSWIKGYWSDGNEWISATKSYYFTDTNFFYDWGRTKTHDMSVTGIKLNLNKFNENATTDTYTVIFTDYYNGVSGYESHTNKDWKLVFKKTSTGISLTESKGDTTNPTENYTKGKLLISPELCGTWAAGNVEIEITTTNIVLTNKSSGSKMDYTETILPFITGSGNYEYLRGKGYIEESSTSSYKITITDGSTKIISKFEKKDASTITWTQGEDSSVDLTKQ